MNVHKRINRLGSSLLGVLLAASMASAQDDVMIRSGPLNGADRDAFLKVHNDARKEVGLPPLKWSDDLAAYGLEWLKENQNGFEEAARKGELMPMQHRPAEGKFKQKYGENLATWAGRATDKVDGGKAPTLWLEEKPAFEKLNKEKPYVIGDEKDKKDDDGNPIIVGHYTQMVWKDTKSVGAAYFMVKTPKETYVIVVANYDPRGNFRGRTPY